MKYYICPHDKLAAWAAETIGQQLFFDKLSEAKKTARTLVKLLKSSIDYGIDYQDSRGREKFGRYFYK